METETINKIKPYNYRLNRILKINTTDELINWFKYEEKLITKEGSPLHILINILNELMEYDYDAETIITIKKYIEIAINYYVGCLDDNNNKASDICKDQEIKAKLLQHEYYNIYKKY
jgi:hypothetical protein